VFCYRNRESKSTGVFWRTGYESQLLLELKNAYCFSLGNHDDTHLEFQLCRRQRWEAYGPGQSGKRESLQNNAKRAGGMAQVVEYLP
jgi:hypothetical protein